MVARDPMESFASIVGVLRQQEAKNLRELMIDEINNHINIRSLSGSNTGRMEEPDMLLITQRWELLIQTIRLFQGGRGAEQYAPKKSLSELETIEEALDAERRHLNHQ